MLQIYVYGLQSCMGCYFVWAVIYRFINSIKEKKGCWIKKKAKTKLDQMYLDTKRPRPKL